MPLRSVKMNRFIFGFHRRVWCPKWTPLSSSCFMVTTAMAEAHSFARRVAATRVLRQGRLSLAPDALRGRAQAVGTVGTERPPADVTRRSQAGRACEFDPEFGPCLRVYVPERGLVERAWSTGRRAPARHPQIPAGPWPALGERSHARLVRHRLHPPLRRRAVLGAPVVVSLLLGGLAAPPAASGDGPGWRFPTSAVPQVLRGFARPRYDWLPGHRGVDLALVAGQAVRPPADGTVSFAGSVAGHGVVTVSHGDLRSTYQPVEAAVQVGEDVAAGDLLGWLEPVTLHCSRTCLHWGVVRGQTYVDPLSLVALGPPILLPLGPPVAVRAAPPGSPALVWASGRAPPTFGWAALA